MKEKGNELFENYTELLEKARRKLKALKHLRLIESGNPNRDNMTDQRL